MIYGCVFLVGRPLSNGCWSISFYFPSSRESSYEVSLFRYAPNDVQPACFQTQSERYNSTPPSLPKNGRFVASTSTMRPLRDSQEILSPTHFRGPGFPGRPVPLSVPQSGHSKDTSKSHSVSSPSPGCEEGQHLPHQSLILIIDSVGTPNIEESVPLGRSLRRGSGQAENLKPQRFAAALRFWACGSWTFWPPVFGPEDGGPDRLGARTDGFHAVSSVSRRRGIGISIDFDHGEVFWELRVFAFT